MPNTWPANVASAAALKMYEQNLDFLQGQFVRKANTSTQCCLLPYWPQLCFALLCCAVLVLTPHHPTDDLVDCAGSQQGRIKAIKRKTHPLSHSTSFPKAPSSGKSALPATYSGRYSKQPSTQSLRHSTGSLKATLRQAAQPHAEHAGQRQSAKHAQASNRAPTLSAAAESPSGINSSKHAQRALQAPVPSAAKPSPAETSPHSARVPAVNRAAAVHAWRSQATDMSQHVPSRLAADPNAANDLASSTAKGSHASSEAALSPWSSKSPNGQLSALERMLQALPERSSKRAQHEQVGYNYIYHAYKNLHQGAKSHVSATCICL